VIAVTTSSCDMITKDKDKDSSFHEYKEQFIEKLWELEPSWALSVGYHKYDTVLQIPNAELREWKRSQYAMQGMAINYFKPEELNDVNRTDFGLIKDFVESQKFYHEQFKSYEWNPSNYNVGGSFAKIAGGSYAPLDERLKTFLVRLKNVPAYYEAARENIVNPTLEHTELAIIQNNGSLNIFGQSLVDSLEKSGLSDDEKNMMMERVGAAKTAITDYVSWLENKKAELENGGGKSFRIGKELYNGKFHSDIVSSYTADEIYEVALEHKKELHSKMFTITAELWKKYFGDKPMPEDKLLATRQMIDVISLKHVHRDSFQTAIEKQIPELVNFINEKDLLTQDPDKPLVVRRMPAYQAGIAGANIQSPGPYDAKANTYYNVSPLSNYTDEEAESWLREYNHYILQILNIHEAIPGHYTQLVYANKSPSMIKSILGNGAMIEGWAVYTEKMMLEEGYGNNEPEMWLMYYKWNMRSTCNTILDYSVHVLGMEKEAAMDLLMNEAFQQKAEAEGKWKRVQRTQVQLCSYFTGYYEIYKLREDLKEIMGDDFNLKAFHEEFLSYGSAPVKYIRVLMMLKHRDKTPA
ncbi:MAG: DUF885 domain-containing protein, partial [Bacteroidia bacterium]|nr:DUF885 domain-containing protein [Bacteroidia bacterium]